MYEEALTFELNLRGLEVRRQHGFRVIYKGQELDKRLVIDLIVNEQVIVEVKATEKDHPIFKAQLLTYLRVTDKRLGLLVNFGQEKVADGFSRVVNKLLPPREA